MFKNRIMGLYQLLVATQITLAVALYWGLLMVFARYYHPGHFFDIERYGIVCLLMIVTLIFTASASDIEKLNLLQPNIYDAHQISLRRTFAVLLSQLLFIFAIKNDTMSRFFLFGFLPILYSHLFFSHRFMAPFLAKIFFTGEREHRTLVCGTKVEIQNAKYWIKRKESLGIKTVAVLLDNPDVQEIDGLPVLGNFSDLERVLKDQQIAQVIILHIPEPKKDVSRLYRLVEKHGARLLIVNDLQEIIGHSIVTVNDDGLSFISVRQEPLENLSNRITKRCIDIFISLFVILLILPWMSLLIWIIQRIQSPGPLLHCQNRSGMHNRIFKLLKFRTMHVHNGPISKQAEPGDPRVFAFGRLLRRFSLDELPQFWNVLIGDMSVVGPRPHLLEHNADFAQVMGHYQVRSFVKPGITGLAQVRGLRGLARDRGLLIARIVSDLYYIENWSLTMDLIIILRTTYQMFFPPKAAL